MLFRSFSVGELCAVQFFPLANHRNYHQFSDICSTRFDLRSQRDHSVYNWKFVSKSSGTQSDSVSDMQQRHKSGECLLQSIQRWDRLGYDKSNAEHFYVCFVARKHVESNSRVRQRQTGRVLLFHLAYISLKFFIWIFPVSK